MGRLADAELEIKCSGHSDNYEKIIEDGSFGSSYKNQIKYMLAISNRFNEFSSGQNVLYIGGIGVLGNLIRYMGERAITEWRGTHDIDLALRSRDSHYLLRESFDLIDVDTDSLSVANKRTLRGNSVDFDGTTLAATSVDVYVPQGNPHDGVNIQGVTIFEDDWDVKPVDVFGVPIRFLGPLKLLDMKLAVANSSKNPRDQDCEDILTLIAISEFDGLDPLNLRNYFSFPKRETMRKVVSSTTARPTAPSKPFVRGLLG